MGDQGNRLGGPSGLTLRPASNHRGLRYSVRSFGSLAPLMPAVSPIRCVLVVTVIVAFFPVEKSGKAR